MTQSWKAKFMKLAKVAIRTCYATDPATYPDFLEAQPFIIKCTLAYRIRSWPEVKQHYMCYI